MGSSPLARGTLTDGLLFTETAGLIPARAGNTGGVSPGRAWWWAHPRSRGEHAVMLYVDLDNTGSSPLARGTL